MKAGDVVEFLFISIVIIFMTGTIKTLKTDNGFGFIAREGETKDLFFHSNDVEGGIFDQLKVGDAVTFELKEDPKGRGPAAVNVTRAQ